MRISESKLRSIIKDVINESFEDEMGGPTGYTSHSNPFGMRRKSSIDLADVGSRLNSREIKSLLNKHDLDSETRKALEGLLTAAFHKEMSMHSGISDGEASSPYFAS
jgi:hypothetical protein